MIEILSCSWRIWKRKQDHPASEHIVAIAGSWCTTKESAHLDPLPWMPVSSVVVLGLDFWLRRSEG